MEYVDVCKGVGMKMREMIVDEMWSGGNIRRGGEKVEGVNGGRKVRREGEWKGGRA